MPSSIHQPKKLPTDHEPFGRLRRLTLNMVRDPDKHDHAPKAWMPPKIACRRCQASAGLHTQIQAFDRKPAYDVYLCEGCDYVEFVEAT